jgi:radical SAM protein with 4Fe4S-binding SPASM domain
MFELHNEPLLDKRIFELIKYVKSKAPGKLCLMVTNGELLDKFNPGDIIQSNLDELTISLNATSKDTYERISNGLSYDRVTNNISTLLANPVLKQRLSLSFLLLRENADEVYQAVRYWKTQGVGTRVIEPTNRTGLLSSYEEIKPVTHYREGSLVLRIRQLIMSMLAARIGCFLPFYHMTILFNGDCIVCCHDWGRASVVGNLKTASLRDIWNGQEMNRIRRLIRKKNYKQIGACSGCSLAR